MTTKELNINIAIANLAIFARRSNLILVIYRNETGAVIMA